MDIQGMDGCGSRNDYSRNSHCYAKILEITRKGDALKNRNVLRSAGIIGGFTALSRTLGMVRDIFIAFYFGTSLLASAFLVAFTLPNLFRRLFGEGALSSAFVPVFIETRKQEGEAAAWTLANRIISLALTTLLFIALAGVLFFTVGTHIPELADRWIATFGLSRVMFPYVLFICLAALAMAILNSYKHFSTPAFAPCLLNIILIIVMAVLFPLFAATESSKVYMLAWAVLLAGAAQLLVQVPALRRFGFNFRYSGNWRDPRVRQVLLLMGPAALGLAVTQINVLIDKLLALWIGPWAPAALFYSERLIYLPLGVFATAMGTVLLPTFSSQAASKNRKEMLDTINHSIRQLLYIMVPAAIGLLVLAPDIFQALHEWGGKFNAESTHTTALALQCYAPGLIAFSLAKVFVPAFYSIQDTRTPVKIGILTVALNLTLNITFILTLPLHLKHAGMALATVIAETFGMITLGILLSRRIGSFNWLSIITATGRFLICAALMGAAAWWIVNRFFPICDALFPVKVAQFASVIFTICAAGMVYLISSILLHAPEVREIKQALQR